MNSAYVCGVPVALTPSLRYDGFRASADGGQPFDAPTRTVRLLLRDPDEHSPGVDGAWWPRGGNLTAELHDLVCALTPRLGRAERITFVDDGLRMTP